jgi:hypothetical protein
MMQATRLREVRHDAVANDSAVIDASFTVVRGQTLWRRIKVALLAALCAAVVGFMIPPLWIVAQRVVPTLSH